MPEPVKYKYNVDTPALVVLEVLEVTLPSNCEGNPLMFHQESGAKTAMDMAVNTPNQGWAVWDLKILGKETHPEVRKVLISKLTDPMLTFRLYLDLDFWTDEEDRLLEAKFKGKLPQAEKELQEGVVQRKIVGAIAHG